MRVFARIGLCLNFFIVALDQPALGAGDGDIEPAPGPSRPVVTHQPRAQGEMGREGCLSFKAHHEKRISLTEFTARLLEDELSRYRIVTIDGGGVRGAFPAGVVQHLDVKIKAALHELAPDADTVNYINDMPFGAFFQGGFTGTSTGSFICLGLAKQSPLEPHEIVAFYQNKAADIFPSPCQWQRADLCCYPGCWAWDASCPAHSPWEDGCRGRPGQRTWCATSSLLTGCGGFGCCYNCGGLCGPRYGRTALDRELETTFGGGLLKTAAFPVQVTTYNLKSGKSVYMGSLDASTSKYTIADAARCSSAAPTYLGGVRVDQTFIGVDGGMAENNPTAAGLRQAMAAQRAYLKRFADQTPVSAHDFFVLSLGTGQLEQPARAPGLQYAGALRWAPWALEISMDGGSEALNHAMEGILGPSKYIRLQALLPQRLMAMDDPSNVPTLLAIAKSFCGDPREQGISLALREARQRVADVVAYVAGDYTLSMKIRRHFGGLGDEQFGQVAEYFAKAFETSEFSMFDGQPGFEIMKLKFLLSAHKRQPSDDIRTALTNDELAQLIHAFIGATEPKELRQFQFFMKVLKKEILPRIKSKTTLV